MYFLLYTYIFPFYIHTYFLLYTYVFFYIHMGWLESSLADQDTIMERNQMSFIFLYNPPSSTHTSSMSVAVLGFHWSKKSSIEDIILRTFLLMLIYIYIYILRGCLCDVMVKVMGYGIVAREFKLQSHNYVHFWQIFLGKVWTPLSFHLWVGIVSLLFF